MISDHRSDNIPPQINIFNMVIVILMHICPCLPLNLCCYQNRMLLKPHVIQQNVT